MKTQSINKGTGRQVSQSVMASHQALALKHCVVITLELVHEERIVNYLHEHTYSYNWILKQDRENSKVRICVWWREDEYRQFCTTPLRSFLKRLKNKARYDKMDISKIMTTDEGVQIVCQGVSGSISKYYLEEPLYPYLRDLLSFDLPRNPEVSRNRTDQKGKCNLILQMIAPLDNLTKINLLQKLATSILPQVSQQLQLFEDENSYILPDPPSPLITEPPDLPYSQRFRAGCLSSHLPIFTPYRTILFTFRNILTRKL